MTEPTRSDEAARTPEQQARRVAERHPSPLYSDGRPKYHRHFAEYSVHRDDLCTKSSYKIRVYVFDTEDLERHGAFLTKRERAAAESEAVSLRAEVERLAEELAEAKRGLEITDAQLDGTRRRAVRAESERDLMGHRMLAAVDAKCDADTRVEALAAQLRAVTKLHRPHNGGSEDHGFCKNCGYGWPCETIRVAGDVPPPAETGRFVRLHTNGEVTIDPARRPVDFDPHAGVGCNGCSPVAASSPTPTDQINIAGDNATIDIPAVRRAPDRAPITPRQPKPCPSGHTDCTVDCGWCKGTGQVWVSSPTVQPETLRCACGFTDPVYQPPEVHHAGCSFARRPASTENTDEGGDES